MMQIILRDLKMYGKRVFIFLPAFSIGVIVLYPESDAGYFIIGLPLVFMLPLMLFAQDDKNNGIQQLLSMPVSRLDIVRGRLLSSWVWIGGGVLYMVLQGLVLGLFYPDALKTFLGHLNPNTLFLYLWGLSLMGLAFFPLMFLFMGKNLQLLISMGLGLNVLLGIFFFFQAKSAGPDLFELMQKAIQQHIAFHQTLGNYLLSTIALLLVTAATLQISQLIFKHKEF